MFRLGSLRSQGLSLYNKSCVCIYTQCRCKLMIAALMNPVHHHPVLFDFQHLKYTHFFSLHDIFRLALLYYALSWFGVWSHVNIIGDGRFGYRSPFLNPPCFRSLAKPSQVFYDEDECCKQRLEYYSSTFFLLLSTHFVLHESQPSLIRPPYCAVRARRLCAWLFYFLLRHRR